MNPATPTPIPENYNPLAQIKATNTGFIPVEDLPNPEDFGLPSKFPQFRNEQRAAFSLLSASEVRFQVVQMGTGTGKSLAYFAFAYLSGKRAVILTATKGLQDQAMSDFAECGLKDVRGRANYTCQIHPSMTCEVGHHSKCPYDGGGDCAYSAAVTAARKAPVVITNYKYYMLMAQHAAEEKGLGKFYLLILDEGHSAESEICSAAAKELTEFHVRTMLGCPWPTRVTLPGIQVWAQEKYPVAQARLEVLQHQVQQGTAAGDLVRQFLEWKTLADLLKALSSDLLGQWAIARTEKAIKVEPLWAAGFAESMLFRGVQQVAVFSATLVPKTAQLLGMKCDEYDYVEIPSPFPAHASPTYHIPTAKVSKDITTEALNRWLGRIKEILTKRSDRRGIVHSVSYKRGLEIVTRLANPRLSINESARQTNAIVKLFKDRLLSNPTDTSVLVSPSITTGYDFPFAECEFQIIAKLPFADLSDPITQQRIAFDRTYSSYLTAQDLVQMCGRGMRANNDRCENFIIDDNISWFLWREAKPFIPNAFLKSFRKLQSIPPAPPPLPRKNR